MTTPSATTRLNTAIRARLASLKDEIDTAYWAFTRTARGAPPAVSHPHLYTQRTRLRRPLHRWNPERLRVA